MFSSKGKKKQRYQTKYLGHLTSRIGRNIIEISLCLVHAKKTNIQRADQFYPTSLFSGKPKEVLGENYRDPAWQADCAALRLGQYLKNPDSLDKLEATTDKYGSLDRLFYMEWAER